MWVQRALVVHEGTLHVEKRRFSCELFDAWTLLVLVKTLLKWDVYVQLVSFEIQLVPV